MITFPLSLSYRMGITLASGLLLLGLIIGMAIYKGAGEILYQSQHERALALAQQLAIFSIDAVLIYDYATIERYAEQLGKDKNIIFINIRRTDNEVLAHIGERPKPNQTRYRTILEPMVLGTTLVGQVELAYDQSPVQQKLNFISMIGFISLIILIIAAFWFQRYILERGIIRPVQKLAHTVHPLSSTNHDTDMKKMPEELQRLSMTFHQLREEVATHINERTKAEKLARTAAERLCREQRMASVGQMAAGLAHALNTPLGNIRGYTQLARENLIDKQLDNQLAIIEEQTLICSGVVENLLTAVRPQETHLSNFDLIVLLKNTLAIMRPVLYDKGIQIIHLEDEPPLVVYADPASLEQIIFNLFSNAAQADATQINISIKHNSSKAYIKISDNGRGLPLNIQEQLFEAFNTSKPSGQGTGLGLHLCRSLSRDMGGDIQLFYTDNSGTTFELTLQRALEFIK